MRYLEEGDGWRDGDHVEVATARAERVLGIDVAGLEPVLGRAPATALERVVNVVEGARVHRAHSVPVLDGVLHSELELGEVAHTLHVEVDCGEALAAEDEEKQREVDEEDPAFLAEDARAADQAHQVEEEGEAEQEVDQAEVIWFGLR